MVRIQIATRWEANKPAVSRAWTSRNAGIGTALCANDFGLSGLGSVATRQRKASPHISARPPEEFLP